MKKPPAVKEAARVNKASIRRLSEQEEFRSICGFRRDLLGPGGGDVAFHYLKIKDSKRHYHKKTTEYYFIAEGEGEVDLDDETLPVKKGDFVVIPPGTKHTSRPVNDSDFQILIVASPPIDPDVDLDHYFD